SSWARSAAAASSALWAWACAASASSSIRSASVRAVASSASSIWMRACAASASSSMRSASARAASSSLIPRGDETALTAESRAQGLHVCDVLLSLGKHAAAAYSSLALVVRRDRAVRVAAEVAQQLAEVEHAAAHVLERRVRVEAVVGQVLVHPVPRARHDLHDAARVGGRDERV